MHKRIWLLTLFVTLVFAGAANAQTEIVLGQGTDGYDVQFNGISASGASVAFTGTCGTAISCTMGNGYGPFGQGTYQLSYTGASPLSIVGPPTSGGYYNMSGAVTFTFAVPGSGSTAGQLVGTLTFNQFNDSPTAPSFVGSFVVTSVSGSLQSLFTTGPSSSTATLFVTTNSAGLIIGNTNPTVTAQPSNGSVFPPAAPAPVPEPASMALLGSGLLALGGTIKSRYFR